MYQMVGQLLYEDLVAFSHAANGSMAYSPWPKSGRSFDTALNVAIWLATASPPIIARGYAALQSSQRRTLATVAFAAWVSILILLVLHR